MNLPYRASQFLPEVDENSGAGSKRIFLLANYYYFGVEMLKEKKGVFTLVAVWFREPIETGRIDDARVGAPRRRDDLQMLRRPHPGADPAHNRRAYSYIFLTLSYNGFFLISSNF